MTRTDVLQVITTLYGIVERLNYRIALQFDMHIGNSSADVAVKFQSDLTILNTNLAASKFIALPPVLHGPVSDSTWGKNFTKWPTFCRWSFQLHFCDWISLTVVFWLKNYRNLFQRSKQHDDSMAPNIWIIGSNAGLSYWHIYGPLGIDELIHEI